MGSTQHIDYVRCALCDRECAHERAMSCDSGEDICAECWAEVATPVVGGKA